MKTIKTGALFAFGWYLGKAIYRAVDLYVDKFNRHLAEKYPESWGNAFKQVDDMHKEYNSKPMNKIGF